MKKKIKKVIMVLFCSLLMCSLTACAEKKNDSRKESSLDSTVNEKSQETKKETDSVTEEEIFELPTIDVTDASSMLEGAIQVLEHTKSFTGTTALVKMNREQDPTSITWLWYRSEGKSDFSNIHLELTSQSLIEKARNADNYIQGDQFYWKSGEKWENEEMTPEYKNLYRKMNTYDNAMVLLKNAKDLNIEGEDVGYDECYQISGIVDATMFTETVSIIEFMAIAQLYYENFDEVNEILKELEPVYATFYIRKGDYFPYRISVDFTDVVNELMISVLPEEDKIEELGVYSLDIELDNYSDEIIFPDFIKNIK